MGPACVNIRSGQALWLDQADHSTDAQAHRLLVSTYYCSVFSSLFTFSDERNKIHQLAALSNTINLMQPTVVVLDMGTNDLADLQYKRVMLVLNLAIQLQALHGIIRPTLPRSVNKACSDSVFQQNAQIYNEKICQLCADSHKLDYHKVRGFAHNYQHDV